MAGTATATPAAKRPDLTIHDPKSSNPHDLDDPFYENKVQVRIGNVIANATRKK